MEPALQLYARQRGLNGPYFIASSGHVIDHRVLQLLPHPTNAHRERIGTLDPLPGQYLRPLMHLMRDLVLK